MQKLLNKFLNIFTLLLSCISKTNDDNRQPDNKVATSLAYKYQNRINSHVPVNASSTYIATFLLAFNKIFNTYCVVSLYNVSAWRRFTWFASVNIKKFTALTVLVYIFLLSLLFCYSWQFTVTFGSCSAILGLF
jgi:hypothetical protein